MVVCLCNSSESFDHPIFEQTRVVAICCDSHALRTTHDANRCIGTRISASDDEILLAAELREAAKNADWRASWYCELNVYSPGMEESQMSSVTMHMIMITYII